jgi:hypothetical protein
LTALRRRLQEWAGPIVMVWLALALRLIWLRDPGFIPDVSFFVRWMRLATQSGVGQVFANAGSSYPPLSVYVLGILGLIQRVRLLDAPPNPAELLALRVAIIAFDLLVLVLLYVWGRRVAGCATAIWAALLYALCPGGIYLSGWWVQIDVWFVLPMALGVWWLAHRRVVLAWAALGVAIGFKLQAAIVLPIFAVGTWRWWGARRLVVGGAALALTCGAIIAPLLPGGQVADLVSTTTQPMRYFQWITLECHNLWFALTPRARDLGQDANRDLNAFVGGVSFRDAGLALLALGLGLILARLFIRSGPRAIYAACAVTWWVFFMLPTRIDARYLFPPLALMLCAGFYQRRWWVLYAGAAVTLLINLAWKSRGISPLAGVLSITPDSAVANAWLNVVMLGLALAFYVAPLFGPAQRQAEREGTLRAMRRGWEMTSLGAAAFILFVILGVMLWRGRSAGKQVALLQAPLRASLEASVSGTDASDRVLIVNWPRAISPDRSVDWGGIIPVTPPALFLQVPDSSPNVKWVQYQPWQETSGLEIEYHGDWTTQEELAALARQADRVVAFSPPARQMMVLAQRQPAVAPPACLVDFDGQACLASARATWRESALNLELTWQVTGTLPLDVTVWVHVVDLLGNLVAQADGDPVGGLLSLSAEAANVALREARVVTAPPGDYRVRFGLYDRVSGQRLRAHCVAFAVCTDDAIELEPHSP